MMGDFKIGDRVKFIEGVSGGDGKVTKHEFYGVVTEILDAQVVYPNPPVYKAAWAKRWASSDKVRATKFPLGTVCCRVQVDGEKHRVRQGETRRSAPRMFHESQLGKINE